MTRETVAAGMLSVHRSKQTSLTLIRMALRKCVTVWLGVKYDSQATNRKQGELPVELSPPLVLLLVAWESYTV
jgi:hypothetical protein